MRNGRASLLPFGFKARAEKKAIEFRNALNLKAHDPLSAFDLACHLNIPILTPTEIGLTSSEANALQRKGSGWWGLTMKNVEGNYIIIYNSKQSPTRQQSTLMHELAHIICEHEFPEPTIVADHPLPLRSYDPAMEEEADCMGGSLQITRAGLLWALERKMTLDAISNHFLASEAMVTFRINMTGVKRQLRL